MLVNEYRKLEGKPPYPVIYMGQKPTEAAEKFLDRLEALGVRRSWYSIESSALCVGIPPKLIAEVLAMPEVKEQAKWWNIPYTFEP